MPAERAAAQQTPHENLVMELLPTAPLPSAITALNSDLASSALPVPSAAPTPAPVTATAPTSEESLSEEARALRTKLRAAFDAVDIDGSGLLDMQELFQLCADLKFDITPEQLHGLLISTDSDGSGLIDFEEFDSAMRAHMLGEADGDDGLGSLFAAKAGSMFADIWSGFATPFKGAFDNIVTASTIFAPKAPQQQEEKQPEQTEAPASEPTPIYGSWDLSCLPPRKAATPKRSDMIVQYSPPKSMRDGVPASTFRDDMQVRTFFSSPRVASARVHSIAAPSGRLAQLSGTNAAVRIGLGRTR